MTLFINACVREDSRTKMLADVALAKLSDKTEEVNLEKERLMPVYSDTLSLRDELINNGELSHDMFKYARQLVKADTILIAAPYWDLSFPSCLKVYLEHIMINGITFCYGKDGRPKSLVNAKRLIYISTAGGPVIPTNEGFDYVKKLAEVFFGIEDVKLFQAELLDVYGSDAEKILSEMSEKIASEL